MKHKKHQLDLARWASPLSLGSLSCLPPPGRPAGYLLLLPETSSSSSSSSHKSCRAPRAPRPRPLLGPPPLLSVRTRLDRRKDDSRKAESPAVEILREVRKLPSLAGLTVSIRAIASSPPTGRRTEGGGGGRREERRREAGGRGGEEEEEEEEEEERRGGEEERRRGGGKCERGRSNDHGRSVSTLRKTSTPVRELEQYFFRAKRVDNSIMQLENDVRSFVMRSANEV
eukprot:766523-Hanusia_phi.AAC.11